VGTSVRDKPTPFGSMFGPIPMAIGPSLVSVRIFRRAEYNSFSGPQAGGDANSGALYPAKGGMFYVSPKGEESGISSTDVSEEMKRPPLRVKKTKRRGSEVGIER